MDEEFRNALPKDIMLDTYRIERVLGVGGFGITYLAYEVNLGKPYAIKELLPDGLAVRQSGATEVMARSLADQADFDEVRERFIAEARVLASIEHPSVVGVHRLMEDHGTCYMVMDYVEGDTLDAYLKKQGGSLKDADEFYRIFLPMLDGLECLHERGMVHRDVKPGNIMVKTNGEPVLLDFGTVTEVRSNTLTVTQMVSAGYSPFEQYTSKARQGAYTDIYALGATMHRSITGHKPDDSSDRVIEDKYQPLLAREELLEVFGESILAAVDAAMVMDAHERPQSIAELRDLLLAEDGAPVLKKHKKARVPAQKKKRSKASMFVALFVVLASGVAWYLVNELPQRLEDRKLEELYQREMDAAQQDIADEDWMAAKAHFLLALEAKPHDPRAQGALKTLEDEMQKSRGGVSVRSIPSKAWVSLAGQSRKTTPAEFHNLKLGTHEVKFQKAGFEEKLVPVMVRKDKTTMLEVVKLQRSMGGLQLSSSISAAKYSLRQIKSDVAGESPFIVRSGDLPAAEMEIPTGEYLLEISHPEWPTHQQKIQVKSGKPATIEHRFAQGAFSLTTNPSGASFVVFSLDPKAQSLRRELDDLKAEYKVPGLTAQRNQFLRQRIQQLESELRSLKTKEVYRGNSPWGKNLPAGTYRVELKHPGFQSQQFSFKLESNAKVEREIELKSFTGTSAGERRVFQVHPNLKMAFRWCPPTSASGFSMGSKRSEKDRDEDEVQHQVVLTKGFWLAETECTQEQWKAVLGGNPSKFTRAGGYAPVEQVSWNSVQVFLRKLEAGGALASELKAALPTEAQWEYACRAGTTSPAYFGTQLGSRDANVDGRSPYGGARKGSALSSTAPVKSYEPNDWGLYDMHGNVWEWCADIYGAYPNGTVTNPQGARGGAKRVMRGGGWKQGAKSSRSANRGSYWPNTAKEYLGFRLSLQVQ